MPKRAIAKPNHRLVIVTRLQTPKRRVERRLFEAKRIGELRCLIANPRVALHQTSVIVLSFLFEFVRVGLRRCRRRRRALVRRDNVRVRTFVVRRRARSLTSVRRRLVAKVAVRVRRRSVLILCRRLFAVVSLFCALDAALHIARCDICNARAREKRGDEPSNELGFLVRRVVLGLGHLGCGVVCVCGVCRCRARVCCL